MDECLCCDVPCSNPGPRLLVMALYQSLILLATCTGTCCQDKGGTKICSTLYRKYTLCILNFTQSMHHHICTIPDDILSMVQYMVGISCLMLTAYWFTDNWLTRGGCNWRRVSVVDWYVGGWKCLDNLSKREGLHRKRYAIHVYCTTGLPRTESKVNKDFNSLGFLNFKSQNFSKFQDFG